MQCRVGLRGAIALVAVAAAFPASALDPARQLSQFGHRSWTQQQGLPQDSVRAIAQAPDGALWIGTDEGLARFDGTDFTVYRQSADGLPGSLITTLIAARDGSIWVGTLAGVSRLRDGRFTNYTSANGLGTPTVSDLFESADGTIWAVGGRLVTAFRPDGIVNYGPEQGVPAEGLRESVQSPDGLLLGRGLCRRRAVRRTAVPPVHQSGRTRRLVRRSLTVDRDGVLWAGTSRGLVSIDRSVVRAATPSRRRARRARARRHRRSRRHALDWHAERVGRREGDRFVRVSAPGFREGVSVWDLFEDRDGGCGSAPAAACTGSASSSSRCSGRPRDSPATSPLRCGRTRAARCGSASRTPVSRRGQRARRVTLADGLASNEVFCLRGTRDGAVLVCTRAGVSRIDQRGVSTVSPTDSLGRQTVYDVAEDAEGRLWLATSNGVVRVEGGRFTQMFGGGPTLADAMLTSSSTTRARCGPGRTTRACGGTRTEPSSSSRRRTGCRATPCGRWSTTPIACCGSARLAGGSAGGATDASATSPGAKAWTATTSGRIITGDKDYLWLGTSLGLARIRRAALFSGSFLTSDDAMYAANVGLRSSQCAPGFPTSSGGRLDRHGRAWVVTSNGLAMIEPADIRRLDPPPAPQIGAVIVDGPHSRASGIGTGVRRAASRVSVFDRLAGHARAAAVPSTGSRGSTPTGSRPAPDALPTTTTCPQVNIAFWSARRSATAPRRAR